ncbi:TetR/AcrR family transcriptional regulator [Janibacter sp. GS2]|uniref:TetR/AcrR family transcriptional regulator n=1 Tax=Janibacter sp. GS2 TaxID=3442646 RepID=UPI003EB7E0E3
MTTASRRRPARERLLAAADDLMFVEGVVLTPVDVILRRSGASAATLYANFGSKDGLIAAALERRLSEWTAAWDSALAEATTPVERLLSIFPALRSYQYDRLHERWCAFSGTAAAIYEPTPEVAAALRAEEQLLSERMLDYAAEVVGPDRAPALADQVTTAYFGTLVGMLRRDQDRSILGGEGTARAIIDSFVGE